MKNAVVTCDSCRKLKLKCGWEPFRPFQPTCVRCQTYGLPCLFNASVWTAAAVREVVPSFPSAPSRLLFWGASSNAGGHPLDLHKEAPPPPPQPYTQHAGFSRPLSPPPPVPPQADAQPQPRHRTRLLINSNMRVHLYDVFFTHIQPVVPVVTQQSLVAHPPTVLLEAAILGVAARHHSSISSTRDFLHIRDVILDELKTTFSFRRRYEPRIQTVQALLLILLRFELCTQTHDDLQSISLRAALACRMAQGLGLHRAFSQPGGGGGGGVGGDQDEALRQNIWALCVYVDTALAAVLGQTPHIATGLVEALPDQLHAKVSELLGAAAAADKDPDQEDDRLRRARAYFLHMVGLVCCLRPVLRCFFGVHPLRGAALRAQAAATLRTVLAHHERFETLQPAHSAEQRRLLQLLATNNRVLFFVGLRAALPEDGDREEDDKAAAARAKRQKGLDGQTTTTTTTTATTTTTTTPTPTEDIPLAVLLAQHGSALVDDACQILEWTTPEILHSAMGQMIVFLYATSRALMVVVDALRGVRAGTAVFPPPVVARLHAATAHAQALMAFLLRSGSWSAFWTQGHTLKAILARLDQDGGGQQDKPAKRETPDDPPRPQKQRRRSPQAVRPPAFRPPAPQPPESAESAAAPVAVQPYIPADVLPAPAQGEAPGILYDDLSMGASPAVYGNMHPGTLDGGVSPFDAGFLLPVDGGDAVVNTFPSTDWDSFFLHYVQDTGWFAQPDGNDMYW